MKRTDRYFRAAKIDMLTALTLLAISAAIMCWMPALCSSSHEACGKVTTFSTAIAATLALMATSSIRGAVYHFRMARAAVRADHQYESTPRL